MGTGEKKKSLWEEIETPSAKDEGGEVVLQVKGSVEDVARFIERTLDTLAKHWV